MRGMRIDNKDIRVSFDFSPRTHLLVFAKDDRFGENGGHPLFVWSLNPRIDRSYKGKDDDVGIPIMYLSENEAEVLKKSGFSYMDLTEK